MLVTIPSSQADPLIYSSPDNERFSFIHLIQTMGSGFASKLYLFIYLFYLFAGKDGLEGSCLLLSPGTYHHGRGLQPSQPPVFDLVMTRCTELRQPHCLQG